MYNTIVPFMNERGNPYQYVAIRSDITQRKKLEEEIIQFNQDMEQKVNERTEELSNREKQLASIFDTVADSIFVLEVKNETDFLFTSVNPAFLLTSGLEYDQVVGKRMNDILPETSLNHVMEKYKKAIETKKIVSWEETSDYPSGRLTGAVSIAPIFDEAGNCIKIIGSVHDLTERKKADKALIESENYLRTIVETEPECVKLIGINGELQSMNPAGLAMIEADNLEQVKGRSILGIIDTPYREAFKKLTQNIFKGKSGKMEFEITGLKGTHRWLETHAVPLKNAEGKIISLLGVTRDITERKKAEDELKKYADELEISNKELEHFAYAASHDLQEPLRMVSSFLNLVEKRIDVHLDDTTRQYINFASDGAERMKRLIQDLLQYSRVGRNKENFASIDLNEVVQNVTHVLDEKIKKNSALITRKTLPVITANKTLITHLFVNLVNNALKYHNGEQTKIEIGSIEEPVNHILYVKDNGIGIDPKFFEMIFIIFKRLHTKKEYSGTGIGLAISKKIVEIHKGKIWVESEPGKGSTFYFSIPKIDE
jgi:PAS domain S-box-containing protein